MCVVLGMILLLYRCGYDYIVVGSRFSEIILWSPVIVPLRSVRWRRVIERKQQINNRYRFETCLPVKYAARLCACV